MKKILSNIFFTTILSLLLTMFTLFWILNDEIVKSLFYYGDLEDVQLLEGITKIETEFYDSRIYLNVHIDKPLTCNKIVDLLGVKPVTVKTKVYFPMCYNVNRKFVQIIYSSGTEV